MMKRYWFYSLSVSQKAVNLRIICFLQQGAYWHDLHIKVRRSENKDCIQINNLKSTVNYQKKTKKQLYDKCLTRVGKEQTSNWVSKFASKQAIEQDFPLLLSPLSKTTFMLWLHENNFCER